MNGFYTQILRADMLRGYIEKGPSGAIGLLVLYKMLARELRIMMDTVSHEIRIMSHEKRLPSGYLAQLWEAFLILREDCIQIGRELDDIIKQYEEDAIEFLPGEIRSALSINHRDWDEFAKTGKLQNLHAVLFMEHLGDPALVYCVKSYLSFGELREQRYEYWFSSWVRMKEKLRSVIPEAFPSGA